MHAQVGKPLLQSLPENIGSSRPVHQDSGRLRTLIMTAFNELMNSSGASNILYFEHRRHVKTCSD
jgi:hypothetical protein